MIIRWIDLKMPPAKNSNERLKNSNIDSNRKMKKGKKRGAGFGDHSAPSLWGQEGTVLENFQTEGL